ncbi:hypothetical protein ACFWNQ_23060 [Streptomyces virginiae]|uniref:hypothetical protein n=1 Tax=Streptomyces virginiae TaxID=1961 RepID=UPI00365D7221
MPSTALSLTALPGGLVALPGVYQPQADTRLLAAARGARVTAVEHGRDQKAQEYPRP